MVLDPYPAGSVFCIFPRHIHHIWTPRLQLNSIFFNFSAAWSLVAMPRNTRPDQRRSLNVFDRILDTILRDPGSSNSRRAQRRRAELERAQKDQQADSAPLEGDDQQQSMPEPNEQPEATEQENVAIESADVESAVPVERSETLEENARETTEVPPISSQSSTTGTDTAQETTHNSIPSVPSSSQHESDAHDSQDSTTQSNPPHRHFHFFPIPRSLDGSTNEGDSNGTILITVNYVFSDNNNPQNPNRLGSLVMTFPDNASNRQPRIMQELVRYATLMAYRTIVSGLHKKVGTTVEKFNSFPTKHQVEGSVCSICFDEYESDGEGNGDREQGHSKRRRLNSPDPLSGDDVTYQASPNVDAPLLPQSPLPPADTTTEETPSHGPKYLSDDSTVYKHVPAELPCRHVFGRSCLYEWLKTNTTCPLCRQKVEEDTAPAIISPTNTPNEGTTPIMFLNGGRALNSLDSLQNSQDNTNSGREGGVLSNILSYLRGPRETLFPQGVSSRRTESGVETASDVVDYMNLGDLTRQADLNEQTDQNGHSEENENEHEQAEGHTEGHRQEREE